MTSPADETNQDAMAAEGEGGGDADPREALPVEGRVGGLENAAPGVLR